MTAIASQLINGLLAVKPLAKFAKNKARTMMMDRAETIGVYWRDEVKALKARGTDTELDQRWEEELRAIANPHLTYPRYYTTSFHAYDEGNLGWLPAMEVDVAARAVHARIWPEGDDRAGINGDASLRNAYHQVLKAQLDQSPEHVIDLGCSVGRSTMTLQDTFPDSAVTGVDLSPYFLTVAQHAERTEDRATAKPIQWVHAAAEETGLSDNSADLVSSCLMFHELPTAAAEDIITEAYRLVRPGGYFAIMDMNPQSEIYAQMPPYILTLLKSTEPYLDQYFALDIKETFQSVGFEEPEIVESTPRHRVILGRKKA
ncbi:MAG: SAM-dependent methyltransferase [Leptolyngbya foveolarum]|uniref:SAM-dependent methyltransferase n=1 Tax=Leptolyngbya foveolarum TaxID=47253 RepID=A0A2W4UM93_9CYAN|nr:MAG: SAM-dependent methyltransferase [Leptolyngbya foveolarum]